MENKIKLKVDLKAICNTIFGRNSNSLNYKILMNGKIMQEEN